MNNEMILIVIVAFLFGWFIRTIIKGGLIEGEDKGPPLVDLSVGGDVLDMRLLLNRLDPKAPFKAMFRPICWNCWKSIMAMKKTMQETTVVTTVLEAGIDAAEVATDTEAAAGESTAFIEWMGKVYEGVHLVNVAHTCFECSEEIVLFFACMVKNKVPDFDLTSDHGRKWFAGWLCDTCPDFMSKFLTPGSCPVLKKYAEAAQTSVNLEDQEAFDKWREEQIEEYKHTPAMMGFRLAEAPRIDMDWKNKCPYNMEAGKRLCYDPNDICVKDDKYCSGGCMVTEYPNDKKTCRKVNHRRECEVLNNESRIKRADMCGLDASESKNWDNLRNYNKICQKYVKDGYGCLLNNGDDTYKVENVVKSRCDAMKKARPNEKITYCSAAGRRGYVLDDPNTIWDPTQRDSGYETLVKAKPGQHVDIV